jgi:DNA-directed RNA polymerase specialized sigma24 family protein
MDRTPAEFPSREEGLTLHVQLCALNPAAVADACRAYLDPLLAWLAAKHRDVDPHLRQTATHDALMSYVQAPHSYDPARMELGAYLRMAARGDLLNLRKREGKHQKGRVALAVVEDEGEDGNLSVEEEPSVQLEAAEEAERCRDLLKAMTEDFTEEERRVLELMLAGERTTSVYASVLRLEELPANEREREVKKVKDRIKKRLERGVPRHG